MYNSSTWTLSLASQLYLTSKDVFLISFNFSNDLIALSFLLSSVVALFMFSQLVFLYIFQITVVACKAVGSFYVPRKLRPWGHHLFTSFTPVLDVLLQAANKMNFLLVLVQGEQIHTHTVTALQVAPKIVRQCLVPSKAVSSELLPATCAPLCGLLLWAWDKILL